MRRILLLTTLAAMLAAAMALSGVAYAKAGSDTTACKRLAVQTLGSGFKPNNYTFVIGTYGNDSFTGTDGKSGVFCGFGGNDVIANRTLERGDIFFGGEDSEDWWLSVNYGTFYCGPGDDWVGLNYGTFYGDADLDQVRDNYGTFNGGEGNDYVVESNNGTLVQ